MAHTWGNSDTGAKARGPTSVTSTVRKRSGTSRDLPVVLNDTWTGSTVCFWKSTFTLHMVLKKESQSSVTGKWRVRVLSLPDQPAAISAGQERAANTRRVLLPERPTPARDTAPARSSQGCVSQGFGGGWPAGQVPGDQEGPRPPSVRAPERWGATPRFPRPLFTVRGRTVAGPVPRSPAQSPY